MKIKFDYNLMILCHYSIETNRLHICGRTWFNNYVVNRSLNSITKCTRDRFKAMARNVCIYYVYVIFAIIIFAIEFKMDLINISTKQETYTYNLIIIEKLIFNLS